MKQKFTRIILDIYDEKPASKQLAHFKACPHLPSHCHGENDHYSKGFSDSDQ